MEQGVAKGRFFAAWVGPRVAKQEIAEYGVGSHGKSRTIRLPALFTLAVVAGRIRATVYPFTEVVAVGATADYLAARAPVAQAESILVNIDGRVGPGVDAVEQVIVRQRIVSVQIARYDHALGGRVGRLCRSAALSGCWSCTRSPIR